MVAIDDGYAVDQHLRCCRLDVEGEGVGYGLRRWFREGPTCGYARDSGDRSDDGEGHENG